MSSWFEPDRGRKRGYWHNVLMGIDQGVGTWFGIDADETISSYIGRTHAGTWQETVINWIMYHVTGKTNHCKNSIGS